MTEQNKSYKSTAIVARGFIQSFIDSSKDADDACALNMVVCIMADLIQEITVNMTTAFANKKKEVNAKNILELILDNLVLYSEYLRQQLILHEFHDAEIKH